MSVDLSIVIVSWNTRELLRDCLASLDGACASLDYEVFVVDNDSADGSAEMVQEAFPQFTLIKSGGNLGFSKGNNLAFGQCGGDFILMLNPDTLCPVESLTTLVAWAQGQKNLGAVSPMLTDAQGQPTITSGYFPAPHFHWLGFLDPLRKLPGPFFQRRIVNIPLASEPSGQVDYIAGACFLIPRPALEKIGLLDERFFMYFEETDWCWRAHQAGLEIWYCADAKVAHLEGRSAQKASTFTTLQFQKSYRLFIEKNYGTSQVWKYRLAQFFEFSLKGMMGTIVPWNRLQNRSMAPTHFLRARLQLKPTIDPALPRTQVISPE